MTRGPFVLDEFHRNIADEELLDDLRRAASEAGATSLTMTSYADGGRFGAETIRRRFGSWNKALVLAGLQPTKRWRIPDEQLFFNLEAVWRHLGRQPVRSDLSPGLTSISSSVYEQRFGTWRAALEAFIRWVESGDNPAPRAPAPTDRRRTQRQPSLRVRFRVMSRDRYRCQCCGRGPASSPGLELCVDHIVAWANGGETTLENLQTLCEPCNQGKGTLGA